jgi:hypothetical protein
MTGWENLNYKRAEFFTDGGKMSKGFFTSERGPAIFRALSEYQEGKNYEVSKSKWKMTMAIR